MSMVTTRCQGTDTSNKRWVHDICRLYCRPFNDHPVKNGPNLQSINVCSICGTKGDKNNEFASGLAICAAKGCYIKFAQHASQMDLLIPPQYIETFRPMLGECPVSSPDAVQSVIRAQLGAEPSELFETFDLEPIASASLAQVHIARARGTGQKLAVKVHNASFRSAWVTWKWILH